MRLFYGVAAIAAATATFANAKPCVVVLSDNKYSVWAETFLADLKQQGNVTAKKFCLDGGLSAQSKSALRGLCTIVPIPKTGGYVHYAKLQLFTNPLFRAFTSITYFDVDHLVYGPVKLPTPPFKQPLLMTSKGCKSKTGRHREFERGVSSFVDALLSAQFDRDGRCFSTRAMSIDVHALPAIAEMQNRIDYLIDKGVKRASKFWEQGFIQVLFWNASAPFDEITEHRISRWLVHLYHIECNKLDSKGRCLAITETKRRHLRSKLGLT